MSGMLIDDFTSDVSVLGTKWEGFTDRVMGGKSDMTVGIRYEDDRPHLAMSGRVSLENNGGFIQARLLLAGEGHSFDASAFSGFRVTARGRGDDYYLFVRTKGNVFPWSFFMAKLPVSEEWEEVLVPWSSFSKGDFGSFFGLNTKKLTSVAVVAYKKEFSAKLDVRSLSFY